MRRSIFGKYDWIVGMTVIILVMVLPFSRTWDGSKVTLVEPVQAQQTLVLKGTPPSPESLLFEGYRKATLSLLDEHASVDPNCPLLELRSVIETTYFNYDNIGNIKPLRAFALAATKDQPYNRVIFNTTLNWNNTNGPLTILHEALHLAKKCGPDSPKRANKRLSCYLFGQPCLNSQDITDALEEHLARFRPKGQKPI